MGSRILLALLAAGCGTGDRSWSMVQKDEPAALLSIWGVDARDVWVVGGRTTLDGGPTVLHLDHGAWSRVDTGQPDLDLWWVFGFGPDDIFFSGSGGTILHYHGGVFEKMATPRTGTIFGMWGASDTDVWAVGDGGAAGGIVWHFDGTRWTEPPKPPDVASRVFKVHGQSANDVWMSCADGSALHWQGSALEREPTGVTVPLFSIVSLPDGVVAVGGVSGAGQIVEHAAAWSVAPISSPEAWRGTAARDAAVYAVGELGIVAERERGAWKIIKQPLTQANFHAAWVDPDGGLWGAGGDFDRIPLTAGGFLAYLGTDSIPEVRP